MPSDASSTGPSDSFAPRVLTDVNWSLNVQMAHSGATTPQRTPIAVVELTIADVERGAERQRILLDFTHAELRRFYDQLEAIQAKLDELS